MNPSQALMNRRDWFRLGKPRSVASPQEVDGPANVSQSPTESKPDLGTSTELQPIALPPNHDGMDLAALPAMREARLSTDEVLALLTDIETYATDVQLMQRAQHPGARAQPSGSAMAIELARQAITTGRISRLQVRYAWNAASWIDTLETVPNGFRLVRIEHRQS